MIKRVLMFIKMCAVASLLFSPAEIHAACELLADGSFEGGTPNAFWTETSTNFGTPLCDTGSCGGSINDSRTGNWWAWFGGISGVDETGSLTQSVLIPADPLLRLHFYLWNPVTSDTGAGADFLKVTIDGAQLFNMLAGDPLYSGGYTLVDLDLAPYADGGCHTLSLQSTTFNSTSFTNIFVDDVDIVCPTIARVGATPYASLQEAMDAAGNGSEISATVHLFSEDLLFSQTGRVTFKGGYDCAFSQSPGYTTIKGKVTVSGTGTLIVENVIIS
jgi:hypothetical protein